MLRGSCQSFQGGFDAGDGSFGGDEEQGLESARSGGRLKAVAALLALSKPRQSAGARLNLRSFEGRSVLNTPSARHASYSALERKGTHRSITADSQSKEAVEAIRTIHGHDASDNGQDTQDDAQRTSTCRNSRLLDVNGVLSENRSAANAAACHLKRLIQEIPFMNQLPPGVQQKVPSILQFRKVPADYVLFREGDAPDSYYIILSGQVTISAERADTPAEGDRVKISRGSAVASAQCYAIDQLVNQQEEARTGSPPAYEHADDHLGNVVSVLAVGECFGEMGLMNDEPRSASAVTRDDCDFLLIAKADFKVVITQELQKRKARQVAHLVRQLLRELEFFKKLSNNVQNAVPDVTHIVSYPKGGSPFQEGDPPDRCYILISGEVSVWKSEKQCRSEVSRSVHSTRHVLGNEAVQRICSSIAIKLSSKSSICMLRSGVKKVAMGLGKPLNLSVPPAGAAALQTSAAEEDEGADDGLEHVALLNALAGGHHPTHGTLVALFGPGAVFGELALINDDSRSATVVCDKACEFLAIEKTDFDAVLKEEMHNDRAFKLPAQLPPLVEEIPFFAELAAETKHNLPHVMKFCTHKAGSVLFWEGDPPSACYFILSGQVSVWVSSLAENLEISAKPQKGTTAVRKKCNNLISIMAPEAGKEGENQLGVPQSTDERTSMCHSILVPGSMKIALLGQGILFGEAALVDDKPRNATIKCDKDCHMLVIQKPEYDTVLREEVSKQKVKSLSAQVLRLLKEFSVFQQLEPKVQATLPEVVRYSKSPRDTVLFEQGSAPQCCYIILSGVVTVVKRVDAEQHEAAAHEAALRQTARARLMTRIEKPSRRSSSKEHNSRHRSSGERMDSKGLCPQDARTSSRGDSRRPSKERSTREKLTSKDTHASHDSAEDRRGRFHSARSMASGGHDRSDSPHAHARGPPPQPSLAPVSAATMHKCMALANIFSKVEGAGTNKVRADDADQSEDQAQQPHQHGVEDYGMPVAALGAGLMFGELALLSDQVRDATVICREDCEFLLVNKADFDEILKAQIKKTNREKIDFLKAHAPVMRSLPDATCDTVLRNIENVSVPRHHMFITLGEMADSSVYFVWKGAVECFGKAPQTALEKRSTPRKVEPLKFGILMKGSVFGSVTSTIPMPYSIIAASSPCEVLRISADILRQLPDSIVQGLHKFIEQGMSRRRERQQLPGAVGEMMSRSVGGMTKPVRPATANLPPTKGFIGGDLPRNLHLGNTSGTPIGPCQYRRAPAPADRPSTPEKAPAIVVEAKSARDKDRRAQLRSSEGSRDPKHRRSVCSSSALSRAESFVMSRSPSRSVSPSKSTGFIDTGSRSPSCSNLRAALSATGERPFVDVALQESGLISKAGKHPACDYALI